VGKPKGGIREERTNRRTRHYCFNYSDVLSGFCENLNDVNSTCSTSYSCGLCHIDPSGGGPLTTEGQAFKDSGHDACYFCPSTCNNPTCTDNDSDGYFAESGCSTAVDCDDNDPNVNPGAAESCTNGVDDDCDGFVDATDPNAVNCPTCTDADLDGYFVEPGCGAAGDCNDLDASINPGTIEDCFNGVDDDCDGYVDGADSDCGACIPTSKNEKGPRCSDGLDNDCDTVIDSADPDCAAKSGGTAEICTDGIDNDGDRKIDCADKKDCGKDPACQ
jgi:hypothetical protein